MSAAKRTISSSTTTTSASSSGVASHNRNKQRRGPANNKLSASSANKQKGGVTSLAPFLRFLVGAVVVVELKNGKCIRGTLDSADDYMNLILTKPPTTTTTYDDNHKQHTEINISNGPLNNNNNNKNDDDDLDFSRVHIRGPSIRYVHLPSHADVPQLIRNGLDRERAASDRYQRGKRTKR